VGNVLPGLPRSFQREPLLEQRVDERRNC
jgi:hypothetical protein